MAAFVFFTLPHGHKPFLEGGWALLKALRSATKSISFREGKQKRERSLANPDALPQNLPRL